MAYLELVNITKRYRNVVAVDDLSLSVERGEMLCLLGPSGCGKTTTLRIIAGFEPLQAGMLRLGGQDITHMPPEERDIGVVFQNYALFPHMTVTENIGFGLLMRRRSRREIDAAVAEALALVRLDGLGHRYPRELSGGQQQRVALARAIAIRPRLLLLDEPLSNLDAKLRDSMRDEIRRVQQEVGITAIFVTHDQVEALAMADRMAVMNAGRVLQFDTPVRVYERPAHPFIAEFIGNANLLRGHVVTRDGTGAAIEIASGLVLRGHTEAAFRPNEDAMAVVKTECVRLSRTPDPSEGVSLKVRVESRSFVGPSIVYDCAAGPTRLKAVLPSTGGGFAVAEELYASWSEADCLIIPAEGLAAGRAAEAA